MSEKIVDETETKSVVVSQTAESDETAWQAIRAQPKVFAWCVYAIFVTFLNSFDYNAAGSVISIPEFRKDFGYLYEGEWTLEADWQSAFSGGALATSIIASMLIGSVADRIGRRPSFIGAFAFIFAAITCEFVATSNAVFCVGKLLSGVGLGICATITMTYVGEIAPFRLRGMLTAACAVAFNVAPLISSVIIKGTGNYTNRWAYRAVFTAQYGFTGIGFLLVPFIPESPWYYMNLGKTEHARKTLARLGYSPADTEKKISDLAVSIEESRRLADGATYFECLRKTNLLRTLSAAAPMIFQSLCGILFVNGYLTYYAELSGFSTSLSYDISIIYAVLSILGNFIAIGCIDKVGRRNLTVYGIMSLTALLFVTGGIACIGSVPAIKATVILFLVYSLIYNASLGTTGYAVLTELPTARLRSKTVSLGFSFQYCLYTMWAFVLPYLFNPNEANLKAKVAFIFGAFSLLGCIWTWFFLPEIAGRTYYDIDQMYHLKVSPRAFKSYEFEPEGQPVSP